MMNVCRQKKAKFFINASNPIDVEAHNSANDINVSPWIPELHLNNEDRIVLSEGKWLNDKIIDAAQSLLKKANPAVGGLQRVCLGQTMAYDIEAGEFVQILHDRRGHWLTISTIGSSGTEVHVFDSLYPSTGSSVKMQISCLLHTEQPHIKLLIKDVQMQSGTADCGMFAIAFATALIYGKQPGEFCFDQSRMRTHLMECLEARKISMFPVKRMRRTASKIKTSEQFKVYCICRMPNFTNSKWIQCSSCKEWYHCESCVKVHQKYLNSKTVWHCFKCET